MNALSHLITSKRSHNQSRRGIKSSICCAVTSGRTRAESIQLLLRDLHLDDICRSFEKNLPFLVSTRLFVCGRGDAPVERFVLVTYSRLFDSSTRHRICYLRCGAGRRGGLFGKSQWRQQTRRCTRICPQRDMRGTRRALEAEVQGEVDRARRSAGGGGPPALPLCNAPDIEQGDSVASAAQLGRQLRRRRVG